MSMRQKRICVSAEDMLGKWVIHSAPRETAITELRPPNYISSQSFTPSLMTLCTELSLIFVNIFKNTKWFLLSAIGRCQLRYTQIYDWLIFKRIGYNEEHKWE